MERGKNTATYLDAAIFMGKISTVEMVKKT
jgi:hypothetical protein